MKRGGWPRPPLILALILGSIMENAFQISVRAYDGIGWLGRPIVLIILALVVITIVLAVRGITKNKKGAKELVTGEAPIVSEGSERSPMISLPFSIIIFVIFVWTWFESQQWPVSVRQFPITAAIPGAILTFAALALDAKACRATLRDHGSFSAAWAQASRVAEFNRAALFFAYLVTMILVMLVVGQKIALPIYIAAYLVRWGDYSWRVALGYAVGGWVLLVGFYDQVMHLFWHSSWLASWLPELLPEWLPKWLFF